MFEPLARLYHAVAEQAFLREDLTRLMKKLY